MAEELGVHHEALRGCIREAEADADDLLTPHNRAEPTGKENAYPKRSNEVRGRLFRAATPRLGSHCAYR
ncbi:hypothetical protein AB0I77_36845 [Streptomyces sp. NPDC050619]|uniref:hypothetical protein n=1 Tax=Streptomyces sp. NPDC050619 TaxID=3157214 RepID=UPI00342A5D14